MTSTQLLILFAVLLLFILIGLAVAFWDWLCPSLACAALQHYASPELIAYVYETLGMPEPPTEAERLAGLANPYSDLNAHAYSQPHPSHPYWAILPEPHLTHVWYHDAALRTAVATSLLSARDPSE